MITKQTWVEGKYICKSQFSGGTDKKRLYIKLKWKRPQIIRITVFLWLWHYNYTSTSFCNFERKAVKGIGRLTSTNISGLINQHCLFYKSRRFAKVAVWLG